MKRILLALLLLGATLPSLLLAGQGVTENYGPVVAEIIERGDIAVENYSPANSVIAGNEFSRLYFDVFETSGMEFTLGLKNNAFMLQIESSFSLMISQSMRGEAKTELENTWDKMKVDLHYAVENYSSGDQVTSFWGRVLQSFLILFREGVEAMLVVAALIAYLKRSGYADKVAIIYHGVIWALVASVGAAWALNSMVAASGANREAMEGITMLIAAAVLVYVSYWLTAKKDADRWNAFIKDKIDSSVGKNNFLALGFVAFLAVFREGAETILFYQALIGGSAGQMNAIWTGIAIALVVLAIVYSLIRLASIRLPLGLFFGTTAFFLFGMAFVFTGQGILELQVSGLIHTTKLEGWPMISWLGIFPTVESISGQAAVVALIPVGWIWLKFKEKKSQPAVQQAEQV
jgi:high-affinity iron transporter